MPGQILSSNLRCEAVEWRRIEYHTKMCRTLIEFAGFKPPFPPLPLSPASGVSFPLPLLLLESFLGAIVGGRGDLGSERPPEL